MTQGTAAEGRVRLPEPAIKPTTDLPPDQPASVSALETVLIVTPSGVEILCPAWMFVRRGVPGSKPDRPFMVDLMGSYLGYCHVEVRP